MKHLTLLLGLALCFSTQHSISYIDQDVDVQLNIFQQSVATLIAQSDIDPKVAQDILHSSNKLNHYIQNNIKQDLKEIRVAAALTSILETVDKMSQNVNMGNIHDFLSNFKYSARANVIHKLLIGAYPGKFKDQAYYTNPYAETIGFTLNDYLFYSFFNVIMALITPTEFGKTLQLNSSSPIKNWAIQVTAGIAAHCAWLLQKKIALAHLINTQEQSY